MNIVYLSYPFAHIQKPPLDEDKKKRLDLLDAALLQAKVLYVRKKYAVETDQQESIRIDAEFSETEFTCLIWIFEIVMEEFAEEDNDLVVQVGPRLKIDRLYERLKHKKLPN